MTNQLVHYQLVRNRVRHGVYVYTIHEAISDCNGKSTTLFALDPLPNPEFCFDTDEKMAMEVYRELEPRYHSKFGVVDFSDALKAVDRYDYMMLAGEIPIYEDIEEDDEEEFAAPEYCDNDKVIDMVEYLSRRG